MAQEMGLYRIATITRRSFFKVNVHGLRVKNDLHEFQFTDDGTALVTIYPDIQWVCGS